MGRDQIRTALLRVFRDKFQIVDPGVDENLRDAYEFDSIDAVELLHEIELMLDSKLTQAEKKSAMDIRTINQIIDYIEALASARRRRGHRSGVEDACRPWNHDGPTSCHHRLQRHHADRPNPGGDRSAPDRRASPASRPLREDGLLTDYIHSGVFGTVDYPIEYDFKRSHRKTMGPVAYYACQVAKEALAASGLTRNSSPRAAWGWPSAPPTAAPRSSGRSTRPSSPMPRPTVLPSIGAVDYLKSMVHTTAVNITKMFGITGRVISSSTACTTSSQSIGFGYETVKFGMQDAMLCGGADEYDTTTVAVFDNLLACSTAFNDTPQLTPRPFDVRARRTGGRRRGRGRAAGGIRARQGAGRRYPGGGHRVLPATTTAAT